MTDTKIDYNPVYVNLKPDHPGMFQECKSKIDDSPGHCKPYWSLPVPEVSGKVADIDKRCQELYGQTLHEMLCRSVQNIHYKMDAAVKKIINGKLNNGSPDLDEWKNPDDFPPFSTWFIVEKAKKESDSKKLKQVEAKTGMEVEEMADTVNDIDKLKKRIAMLEKEAAKK